LIVIPGVSPETSSGTEDNPACHHMVQTEAWTWSSTWIWTKRLLSSEALSSKRSKSKTKSKSRSTTFFMYEHRKFLMTLNDAPSQELRVI
jgi:hypothetical protein